MVNNRISGLITNNKPTITSNAGSNNGSNNGNDYLVKTIVVITMMVITTVIVILFCYNTRPKRTYE